MGYLDHIAMAGSYEVPKPGRGKIDVSLRNHSAKQKTLPKQTAVGEIAATNIIPALLVPKPLGHESGEDEAIARKMRCKSQKELLDKND